MFKSFPISNYLTICGHVCGLNGEAPLADALCVTYIHP
jgi:hypothetical protein